MSPTLPLHPPLFHPPGSMAAFAAPGTRLFIGNLSWNTNDESLRRAFEEGVGGGPGTVIDAKVIVDRYSGRSRYVVVMQKTQDIIWASYARLEAILPYT